MIVQERNTDEVVENLDELDASMEGHLWRRVAWGLVWGFLVAALLAFVLTLLMAPDVELIGQLGMAVFVGFWSGPFIGLSGAVGYNEYKRHTAADHIADRESAKSEFGHAA